MNSNKIIYWIATGIMCLVFLFSAGMYLLNHDMVVGFYQHLGFPTWMIYPSAIAKILALVAILSRKSKMLKEWAYAGLFFDACMALAAHMIVDGGGILMSAIAFVAIVGSRMFEPKAFPNG